MFGAADVVGDFIFDASLSLSLSLFDSDVIDDDDVSESSDDSKVPSANDDLRGCVEKKKGSLFDDTWATCRHVVKVVSVLLPGETNANEGAADDDNDVDNDDIA